MKREMTFLDAFKLLKELSYLQGGRIRDIRSRKNELFLLIYKDREYWLRLVPGSFFCVQYNKPDYTAEFPFTSKLRELLLGKTISLSLHRSDRILEMGVSDYRLEVEIFSKGNIVLAREGEIIWSMFARKYGTRELRSGERYEYPPEKIDITSIGYDDFKKALLSSDKENTVKAAAIDLSLGGVYAEEVVFRAGVDKTSKPGDEDESSVRRIYDELRRILDEETRPNIIDNSIFSVIDLKHIDSDKKYYESIDDAVKDFFGGEKKLRAKALKEDITSKQLERYGREVKFIEDNFDALSGLIGKLRDSSVPLESRKKEAEGQGFLFEGKYMTLLPERDIKIDMIDPLRHQISQLYSKMKSLRLWAERKHEKPQRMKAKVMKPDTWYSKYIWFFTSGGILGILGKNNDQNVSIVRRYAKPGDVVLHADIFGSPFCVLEGEKREVSAGDILEGAVMTASYSSAWKAGTSNIDIYYVDASQVTLSPPSGEYLAKGSFYISGRRNYLHSVGLGIHLGISMEDSSAKLSVSPARLSGICFLLKPGRTSRSKVVSYIKEKVSAMKGYDIPADAIDALLPSGDAEVTKE